MERDERSDRERPESTEEPSAVDAADGDSRRGLRGGYRGPDPEEDPKGDYSDEDQGT